MKFLKSLWDEVVYNGHLQSIGAMAIVDLACLFFDIEISATAFVLLYAMFYLLYLYNREKELEIDKITNKERSAHLEKIAGKVPMIFFVVSLIVIGCLFIIKSLYTTILILAIISCGLLYTGVFKPATRYLPLFKNFYVATVFGLLVYYPFAVIGDLSRIASATALYLSLIIFLKAFAMQILLDLKDIEGDKTVFLKTLGVLVGKKVSCIVLYVSLVILSVFLPAIYYYYLNFNAYIFVFALAGMYNIYYYELVRRGNKKGYVLAGAEFIVCDVLMRLGMVISPLFFEIFFK